MSSKRKFCDHGQDYVSRSSYHRHQAKVLRELKASEQMDISSTSEEV